MESQKNPKTLESWAEETIRLLIEDISKFSTYSTGQLGRSLKYTIDGMEVRITGLFYFYSANKANKWMYNKRAFSKKRFRELAKIQKRMITNKITKDLKK